MLNRVCNQKRMDIASARQWLAEGTPISDVSTMLEVRHRFDLASADCRTYAVEILRAAQQPTRTLGTNSELTPKGSPSCPCLKSFQLAGLQP
jgi:hypothetical protein